MIDAAAAAVVALYSYIFMQFFPVEVPIAKGPYKLH